MYTNTELPERAIIDYKNNKILEVCEEVNIFNGIYFLISYGNLKYVIGTKCEDNQLEYNEMIYNIIK